MIDLTLIFCAVAIIDQVLHSYKNDVRHESIRRLNSILKSCFHKVVTQYLYQKIEDADRKAPLLVVLEIR